MTTLRELVEGEMKRYSESEEDIEKILIGQNSWGRGPDTAFVESLSELEKYEGNTGYGGENLPGVHVWTQNRVYLKATYDGSEWVTSVPRNPSNEEAPESVGGG